MLEITGDDVAQLDDEDLRLLIAKLCAAELRRAGCRLSVLLDGGHQMAADGGVDVRVASSIPLGSLDFIPRSATIFQSKAEDMSSQKILDEMLVRGQLRPAIDDVLREGGAYVIVSSRGTLSDLHLKKRLAAMKKAAGTPHSRGHVDFYDRKRLARWICEYPGVELWFRGCIGKPLGGWQPYGDWSGAGAMTPYLQDDAARMAYLGGMNRKPLTVAEGADHLRELLAEPGRVGRLIGLAGTGKTRFVQALFEPGLGEQEPLDPAYALYTDLGREPNPGARDMILQLSATEQRAIVIVDNCNPATHAMLAALVREHPAHVSLLTVEYDVSQDDEPESTEVFELTKAPAAIIEALLWARFPRLSERDRRAVSEFSGGNARIALALGRTGRNQAALSDGELFRRLFHQGRADGGDLMHAAEVCSLVYSFDVTDTKQDDSEIARLSRLAGASVTDLCRRVATLKKRDLVQSRSRWRAVLPPALSNRLAKQALQHVQPSQILAQIQDHTRLLTSFARRLSYLHDSEEAHTFVCQWLRDPDWLARPATLNDLGRLLMRRVAPVAPDEVLALLEQSLQSDRLAEFLERQRGELDAWMTLLRQLSYKPAQFDRAARLMLCVAANVDAGHNHVLSGWTETFRIALSGTLAPPAQREAFLREALRSPREAERTRAMDAIEASLELYHLTSSHDFDFGAHARSYGWDARSLQEFQDWFRSAFSLVRTLAAGDAASLARARLALANQFRTLWYNEVLHEELQALVTELSQGHAWPDMWTALKSALRLDGAQMTAAAKDRLRAMLETTLPRTLEERIQLYVLPARGHLDVVDAVAPTEEPEDFSTVMQKMDRLAFDLGREASGDELALARILPALMEPSSGFGRQGRFGEGLAEASLDPRARWQQLRDVYARLEGRAVPVLLGGFLQGLRRAHRDVAEALLDALIADDLLGPQFPLLLCPAMSDRDGARLIDSIRGGRAPAFRYGLQLGDGVRTGLSAARLSEVLRELAAMPDGLASALETLGQLFFGFGQRVQDIPSELLDAGRHLLVSFGFQRSHDNLPYRVKEIAKVCLHGARGRATAEAMAVRFAAALGDHRLRGDAYAKLACMLFKLHPEVALDHLVPTSGTSLELPVSHSYSDRRKSVINCAPPEAVMRWAKADPDLRAPALAREIEILAADGPSGLSPMALELLQMTSNRAAVLQGFTKRFFPMVWSGSIADVLRPYQTLLEELSAHAEEDLADWARNQLEMCARRIAHERGLDNRSEESFE